MVLLCFMHDLGTPGNIVGGLAGRFPPLVFTQSQPNCEARISKFPFFQLKFGDYWALHQSKLFFRFHLMGS